VVVEAFAGDEEELMTTLHTGKERKKRTEEEIRESNARRQAALEGHRRLLSDAVMYGPLRYDEVANDEGLQAMALSVVPEDAVVPRTSESAKATRESLARCLLYFKHKWNLTSSAHESPPPSVSTLLDRAAHAVSLMLGDRRTLCVIVAAALRAMGLRTR